MGDYYDIGYRLKDVMAEKGVTISQLADMTGISEDTIKAIRSGKTKSPGIQLMSSIADARFSASPESDTRRALSSEQIQDSQHTWQEHGHAHGGL